ncbi:Lysophospholipase, alpha-beta hydrolase superfamily [Dyadobacter soli]|uniref:Lysophospholipase, alpha-beta hydrolase superfamily n=1 Tax=Dyadobacter soli TaxID=659014 RepID=A0A1G7SNM8_9BACT|nr:alpha/beta hydrolase [Dyadobacter soli]SDG24039.1 Lysophospholipase, alpha-beta hydrolase superfamily [Dyadobacter soli]
MKTKTIMFVTGAFVTHHCWDEWREYFEARGYSTLAPAWPFKDGTAAELRARQPNDVDLARLTLAELVDHYAGIAKSFPEKPIIIGHSLGGLITQILLNRGLASAAVAIHSVPPQGIIPYEFSFLKSTWGALGLFTSLDETYLMPFDTWQYAFVNEMPLEEQQKAYDLFTAPESKRVARGGLTSAAAVDFDKPHAPLLLTSGSLDNIIPAHLNNRNFERYKMNGSVIEYKEFPGRNHHTLSQAGWESDADYILDWIKNY